MLPIIAEGGGLTKLQMSLFGRTMNGNLHGHNKPTARKQIEDELT
jgi:hypothetical protein